MDKFPGEGWKKDSLSQGFTNRELDLAGVNTFKNQNRNPEADLIAKEEKENAAKKLDAKIISGLLYKIEKKGRIVFGFEGRVMMFKILKTLQDEKLPISEISAFYYIFNRREKSEIGRDYSEIDIIAIKSKILLSLNDFEQNIISRYLNGEDRKILQEELKKHKDNINNNV